MIERLLLDTHFVIDAVDGGRRRLPPLVWDALAAPQSTIFVSVASLWEIAVKVRLGRLPLESSLDDLPGALGNLNLSVLAIDEHHVLAELDDEPPTRDPFDRLLLAQCQVENLTLVTIDRALIDHPLAFR